MRGVGIGKDYRSAFFASFAPLREIFRRKDDLPQSRKARKELSRDCDEDNLPAVPFSRIATQYGHGVEYSAFGLWIPRNEITR